MNHNKEENRATKEALGIINKRDFLIRSFV
jgi:hypothetical protein